MDIKEVADFTGLSQEAVQELLKGKMEMTVKQVAEYAGLSAQTVYNLVNLKKIPFERISQKKAVFHKDAIDEWLITSGRRAETKKGSPIGGPSEICGSGLYAGPGAGTERLQNAPARRGIRFLTQNRRFAWALLSAAMLTFGWAGHYFLTKPGISVQNSMKPSEDSTLASLIRNSKIGNLDFNYPPLEKDKIAINVDSISNVKLTGNADSAAVKPLLLYTLRDEKAGYAKKSKTIDVLTPFIDDADVWKTFVGVIKNEKNPLLRMKSISVLAEVVKLKEVQHAMLDILRTDNNTALKFKALEIIEKNVDSEMIAALRTMREKVENGIIKNKVDSICDSYRQKI
jgi:excisionase family DNA binding protein